MLKNVNIEALKALVGIVVFSGSIVVCSAFIDRKHPDIKTNYSQVDYWNKDLELTPEYTIEETPIKTH